MARACIRCRTNGVDEDDNSGLCADCIYDEDETRRSLDEEGDG